jgi:hypothetical protein
MQSFYMREKVSYRGDDLAASGGAVNVASQQT